MWLMYLRINPWIKIFTVVNLTWTRFWSVGFFNFPCCAFYNCVFYFPLQPSGCSGEPYWWAHFDGLHLPTEKKGNIHRHSMHLWPFRSFTLQTSWSLVILLPVNFSSMWYQWSVILVISYLLSYSETGRTVSKMKSI